MNAEWMGGAKTRTCEGGREGVKPDFSWQSSRFIKSREIPGLPSATAVPLGTRGRHGSLTVSQQQRWSPRYETVSSGALVSALICVLGYN